MIGKTLSHYKVLEKIGQGGMGTVYRAQDTTLDREVAIKVLPEQFTLDPQRLARFEREAKLLASLNHPNIAAIHSFEHADDIHFLVLELVPGETLQERVAKGPLPKEEALEVCCQIAEGVEAAHEKGVIHRDLKPANVKVTPEVKVKILDFGLAKAFEDETPVTDISQSPTLTEEMTRAGVILGTAAYMSPEQAKGKPVDKRADIFAFGCVLYELLTGKRAFEGETITETIAAVLKSEPNWEALPVTTPPLIRRLLRRCLTKDRRQRLQAIGDARFEVEDVLSGSAGLDVADAPGGAEPVSGWSLPLTWIMVFLVALLATLLVWNPWRGEAELQASSSLSINLPAEAPSAPPGTMPLGVPRLSLALSPDGSRLVYVAQAGGQRQLYMREMRSGDVKPIPGTEGAHAPFFSFNGEWVAFFADQKLKKVSLSGGTPIVLADAPLGLGGRWASDDTIYFTPDQGKEIFKVSAAGSPVQSVTKLSLSSFGHTVSDVLPGGKTILYTDNPGDIRVYSLESGEPKTIIEAGWGARYVATGHLIYAQPGKLLAIPFDPKKLETTGPSVTVLEGVQTNFRDQVQFTISQTGLLAYVPGDYLDRGRFVWLDRKGNKEPLGLPPGTFGGFALSPDGKTVAIPILDGGKVDIWLYDTLRDIPTRLTFDGLSEMSPSWTPDGKKLVFISSRDGVGNLFVTPVDDSREVVQLTKQKSSTRLGRIPPDGKVLPILLSSAETSSFDVFLLPMEGEDPSQWASVEPTVFLQTPFQEVFPTISPDGRWIAYYSTETGGWEIYVQPLEGAGSQSAGARRVRISAEGGEEPIWSRDGRELFYRWGTKIYVVDVTLGPEFRAGTPRVLFDGPFVNVSGWSYDVSPDGERFLVIENEDLEKSNSELVVITNFFDHIQRLTAAGDN